LRHLSLAADTNPTQICFLFFSPIRSKPDWAKKGPGLKNTGKDTTNLQTPITNIKDVAEGDEKLAWEKPAWAKDGPKLKSTAKGQKLKVRVLFFSQASILSCLSVHTHN